jgi:hypothetical protein
MGGATRTLVQAVSFTVPAPMDAPYFYFATTESGGVSLF